MAKVLLEHVTKRFGGNAAVEDVNLTIQDQEFLVLVGPSGCGKTTTLRLVAGLEEASEGRIAIGDRWVDGLTPRDRDIAMVFQNYALYPHMSVFDNMTFGLKLRKVPHDEIQRRVHEAVEILNIRGLLPRKPRELSGGQRQRVALGRAMVRKPQVFLFDEPLSNLDAELRVQMRVELKRLHERLESTIIYVTHDQVEAMTMGDRIVIMKDGTIQQVGKPLDVYSRPANLFVARFVGTPQMNLLEGSLDENAPLFRRKSLTIDVSGVLKDLWKQYAGQSITLGVRPEDLEVASPQNTILRGEVDIVENLGADQFAHLKSENAELVLRLPSDMDVGKGEILCLSVKPGRIHLFFAGERVSSGTRGQAA